MNGYQRNTPEMTADEHPAVERELMRAEAGDAVPVVPETVTLAQMNEANKQRWATGPA